MHAHHIMTTHRSRSQTDLTFGLGHDFLSILGDAGLLLQLGLEALDTPRGDQVDLHGLLAPLDDDRVRHVGVVVVAKNNNGTMKMVEEWHSLMISSFRRHQSGTNDFRSTYVRAPRTKSGRLRRKSYYYLVKSKDHTANLDDHKCSIPTSTNRNGAILIEG